MISFINFEQQKMNDASNIIQNKCCKTPKINHWLFLLIFFWPGITSATDRDPVVEICSYADTLPSMDAVEAEFLLSAASPEFFTLAGTTHDAFTNEVVRGVKVEVNQVTDTGAKKLMFNGAFYKGQISLMLKRGFNYQLKISKQDYLTREINLEPKDVRSEDQVIERKFVLQKQEKKPNDEAVKNAVAVHVAEKKVSTKHYLLTKATSLRTAPDSKARVMRRLQPKDQVEVLEMTNKWWWKVRFNGKTGYAKALLLKLKKE